MVLCLVALQGCLGLWKSCGCDVQVCDWSVLLAIKWLMKCCSVTRRWLVRALKATGVAKHTESTPLILPYWPPLGAHLHGTGCHEEVWCWDVTA